MANSLLIANSNHFAGIIQDPFPYNAAKFAEKAKVCVSEIQEITKKLEEWQFQYYPENRALNIEVIDDTALIGNGIFSRKNDRERKPKRRGGKGRKKKEVSAKKEVYSREEMEALRFRNLDDQKKKWAEVYGGLGQVAAAEYDGLVRSADIKKPGGPSFRFDRRPFFQKPANLEGVAANAIVQ